MKWALILLVVVVAAPSAFAFTVTVRYQGQTLGVVTDGATIAVPLFADLPAAIQTAIIAAGLQDEYLKLEGMTIELPAGCITEDIIIDVEAVEVSGTVIAFELTVTAGGTQQTYTFAIPPRITLPYKEVAGSIADESELALSYFEAGSFTDAGIQNVTIDPVNDTISAEIAHLSTLAVSVGPPKQLPVAGIIGVVSSIALLSLAGIAYARRRA
jgi:hypothetical protein